MTQKGVTVYRVAKDIGVSHVGLKKVLTGAIAAPGVDVVSRLADYLGVSIESLVRGPLPAPGPSITRSAVTSIGSGNTIHNSGAVYAEAAADAEALARCRAEAAELRGQIQVYKQMLERYTGQPTL